MPAPGTEIITISPCARSSSTSEAYFTTMRTERAERVIMEAAGRGSTKRREESTREDDFFLIYLNTSRDGGARLGVFHAVDADGLGRIERRIRD